MNLLMPGPTNMASKMPEMIVTEGVTRISTCVSFDTILPSSVLITTATSTPTGPPKVFPATPTATALNITNAGA